MLKEHKCIVAVCDGCGIFFDDGEGNNQEYPVLFADEEQAELWMSSWEDSMWKEQDDGGWLCDECIEKQIEEEEKLLEKSLGGGVTVEIDDAELDS